MQNKAIKAIYIFILLILLIPVNIFAEKKGKWEKLKYKNGITSYRREIEGTSNVEFRGTGVVNANVVILLAHLSDTNRLKEWVDSILELYLIERISETSIIYYSCVKAPWPFQNRDYVAKTEFIIDEPRGWLHAKSFNVTHPKEPERSGRTRMPFIRVRYSFKPLSENSTWLEFSAHADPGGAIPSWVANMVSKNLPFNTIENLRKRVKSVKPSEKVVEENKKYWEWGWKKRLEEEAAKKEALQKSSEETSKDTPEDKPVKEKKKKKKKKKKN